MKITVLDSEKQAIDIEMDFPFCYKRVEGERTYYTRIQQEKVVSLCHAKGYDVETFSMTQTTPAKDGEGRWYDTSGLLRNKTDQISEVEWDGVFTSMQKFMDTNYL